MKNVKYVLIVFQLYYSHHCFAVSAEEENFREKALALIEKLEDYKRSGEKREYRYGNDREKAYTDISQRWNVNDSGDIYFIPCDSAISVLFNAMTYHSEFIRLRDYKGISAAQRKIIETDIAEHHNYHSIENAVSSVFDIL